MGHRHVDPRVLDAIESLIRSELQRVGRAETAREVREGCLANMPPAPRADLEAWIRSRFPGLLEELPPEG